MQNEELSGYGYYTTIPLKILLDESLSAKARLLFGVIANLSNQRGYCFASNSYLAKVTGWHHKTVSGFVNELTKAGILIRFDEVTKTGLERRLFIAEAQKTGEPPPSNDGTPSVNSLPPPPRNGYTPLREMTAQNNKRLINKDNKQREGASPLTFDLDSNPAGRYVLVRDGTKITCKIFMQSFEKYMEGTHGPAWEAQRMSIRTPLPIERFFEKRNGDVFNSNQHLWSSFKKLWLASGTVNEERARFKLH